jgi:hypothetical protein
MSGTARTASGGTAREGGAGRWARDHGPTAHHCAIYPPKPLPRGQRAAFRLTVDALLLVGEHLLVVLPAGLIGDLDLVVADDDAHLVILVAGAGALVLGALPTSKLQARQQAPCLSAMSAIAGSR